ncbi:SEC-C metal-binding domain-containing protein [Fibrobacterota bacterium]
MQNNPDRLERQLQATGLPYRELAFIHGALTARSILPAGLDDTEDDERAEDAKACSLLFTDYESMPEKGMDDDLIIDVLNAADELEEEILTSLEDRDFSPWLARGNDGPADHEPAPTWCRGFVTALFLDSIQQDEANDCAEFLAPFGLLAYIGFPDKFPLPEDLRSRMKNFLLESDLAIADLVYDLYGYFVQIENEQDEDYSENAPVPSTRTVPKIGRNAPCPCGSGKKYKKCCGRADINVTETRATSGFQMSGPGDIAEQPLSGAGRCFICGKTENLVKTECCGQWICDDEDQYVPFSYTRSSCSRNHRRYTLCGGHHESGHQGGWKTCPECRKMFPAEMYVWYGTNEYNFEKLPDPPAFNPTFCAKCHGRINLGEDGYMRKKGKYYCEVCEPMPAGW